jgi:hypothetical protein
MSGASKQATALVEEAVGAARELKLPRLLSTALLASAEVRVAGGDARGALADAQAAQKMFASAAQLESEWRAWLVSARSSCLRATAQPHTITPPAPSPVERLSRRAGAMTTTGDTREGPTFKSIETARAIAGSQAGRAEAGHDTGDDRSTHRRTLNMGRGGEGDPGGGQAGGGKRNQPRRRRRQRRSSAIAGTENFSAGYFSPSPRLRRDKF